MKRSLVRGLARWIVVVLLLGQIAIAAHACPVLRGNAADVRQTSAVGVDCLMAAADENLLADVVVPVGTLDADSPNLCTEHCLYGQQSDHTSNVNVPIAVPLAPFENNPPRLVESRLRPTVTSANDLVSACRPHAILHCVRRS